MWFKCNRKKAESSMAVLRWTRRIDVANSALLHAGCSILITLTVLFVSAGNAWAALACTVTPISAAYGVVNLLPGSAVNTTGTLAVTCSGGTANQAVRLCLEIGGGTTALGPSNERTLRSAGDYIDSEFYSDAARTLIWGSWGVGGSASYPIASPAGVQQNVTLNGAGGGTFNYNVYLSIAAGQQTRTPGSYSWTGASPTVQFRARAGASSCPTNGSSSDSSGSTITATINASCNVSATNINFGSIGLLSANIDATGTVTVQCTNTTPYNVGLGAGTGTGATVANRKMTNGAATVIYSLYSNSSRTTVWGNTVGTNTVSSTGSGSNQNLTVYGRVPVQSTPAPATYNDTIVVTVTY
jgi:spore coat protein U-like protein